MMSAGRASDGEPGAGHADDAAAVAESHIPANFAVGGGAARGSPPLRLLDLFSAFTSTGQLCGFDALEEGTGSVPRVPSLCVRGVLLEPDGSLDPRPGAHTPARRACVPVHSPDAQRCSATVPQARRHRL